MHRTNRLSHTILGLAIALAGCGAEGPPGGALAPDEDGEERAPAVVNGKTDQGHPAVGMLLTTASDLCTGTLIGRRAVLTAGHCGELKGWFFRIGGTWIPVVSTAVHPSYRPTKKSSLTAVDASYDLAMLRLQSAPGVEPATIASTFKPVIGAPVSFVGYGITNADGGGAGVRRRGRSHLAGFGSRYLWYGGPASGEPSATCSGDSGGPTFATVGGKEVQVGVNAISDCASMGASARVDAQIDWIRQQAL